MHARGDAQSYGEVTFPRPQTSVLNTLRSAVLMSPLIRRLSHRRVVRRSLRRTRVVGGPLSIPVLEGNPYSVKHGTHQSYRWRTSMMRLIPPTTRRITPTALRSIPGGESSTAKARIAPAMIRKILTPVSIASNLKARLVDASLCVLMPPRYSSCPPPAGVCLLPSGIIAAP